MNTSFNRIALGVAAGLVSTVALATENGADTYGLGAEGNLAGALPPPGFYLLNYYENYHASRFLDKNGKSLIPGFGINVNAVVPRLVWMTNQTIAGGQLGFFALQPLVDLRVSQAGSNDSRQGLGDTVMTSLLAWHNGNQHWVAAMEFSLPTGDYDRHHSANTGNNYYTFRPVFAYSYEQPDGWDLSTKLSWNYNTENHATDYHSGQYLAGDYSLGYHVAPAWTVALQGYAFKQTTSDRVAGEDIGFRGQSLAFGPSVHYQGSGWSLEAKYLRETEVQNRPQGNTTWLKLVWAL